MLREKRTLFTKQGNVSKITEKYYEQNKEEIKQQSNEYYHKNKDNPDFIIK